MGQERKQRDLCFDEACMDLAKHFFPEAPEDRLAHLAQDFQDVVESSDLNEWLDQHERAKFCDKMDGACCLIKGHDGPCDDIPF